MTIKATTHATHAALETAAKHCAVGTLKPSTILPDSELQLAEQDENADDDMHAELPQPEG